MERAKVAVHIHLTSLLYFCFSPILSALFAPPQFLRIRFETLGRTYSELPFYGFVTKQWLGMYFVNYRI